MGDLLLEDGAHVHVRVPTPPTFVVEAPAVPSAVVVPTPGPPGPPGGAIAPHHQTTPAATWTITRDHLYRDPTVILDSNPTKAVYPDVDYPDASTLVVTFPSPVTGWVYL